MSSYNLYNGQFTASDALGFLPAVGWAGALGQRALSTTSLGDILRIVDRADVEFQTYGNRSLFQGEGQAHHLNQFEILGGTVPYNDGITTPLIGDAFRDVGSPHFITHRGTEAFFDVYRPATTAGARYPRSTGWLFPETPTLSQYNRALYNSLQEAGVRADRALRMVKEAKAEQLRAGFRGA